LEVVLHGAGSVVVRHGHAVAVPQHASPAARVGAAERLDGGCVVAPLTHALGKALGEDAVDRGVRRVLREAHVELAIGAEQHRRIGAIGARGARSDRHAVGPVEDRTRCVHTLHPALERA
ncbi:MAG: hypothetical protein ACK559_09495, partial [bacterium]